MADFDRTPVKALSGEPHKVKIDGPVEVSTKGKLAFDLRVQADPGLRVSVAGVDKSQARGFVGNVGLSTVTP